MLSMSFGTLRFGDRASALSPAGVLISGILSFYFGAVNGRRRVGLTTRDASAVSPAEVTVVDVDALRPLDARSGR